MKSHTTKHSPIVNIVHLYPREMNIYGDTGNRIILKKRLEWRGIKTQEYFIGVGEAIPQNADIIIGGGGQDAGQSSIVPDLQQKSSQLHLMKDEGVVMLMICGMYQLFGRSFTTATGDVLKGIGIFELETVARQVRMIGNTVYDSPFGEIVGYENHSGVTLLDSGARSFATVIKGAGNNGEDNTEGCVSGNVYGTYSHGPILVKNPELADGLLKSVMAKKYNLDSLEELDNDLEWSAHEVAKSRPR